mmetsp:Transcript_16487/g.41957  ORF Transcript_16487/g.41957 Transcript_16487/m.41957 type:complete len:210 (+) Transcript_16487:610-1239(+)
MAAAVKSIRCRRCCHLKMVILSLCPLSFPRPLRLSGPGSELHVRERTRHAPLKRRRRRGSPRQLPRPSLMTLRRSAAESLESKNRHRPSLQRPLLLLLPLMLMLMLVAQSQPQRCQSRRSQSRGRRRPWWQTQNPRSRSRSRSRNRGPHRPRAPRKGKPSRLLRKATYQPRRAAKCPEDEQPTKPQRSMQLEPALLSRRRQGVPVRLRL